MERCPSTSEISVDNADIILPYQSSRISKKRAKVWEYVVTEQVDGKEKATCRYCKLQLSCEAGKGTSHLNRHIAYHCLEIPPEDRIKFLASWKPQSADGDQTVFDPEVCRVLVARFFISAEIAFRKADDPCWKRLMNYCHPSMKVVGRQTIRSDCLALYAEERKELMNKVEKLVSHVSLTADLWTSNQNFGYLGVTAHYIDENFELQKKIIAFKQIAFPHTSYAVQDGITSCLFEWNMVGKVFTLTLDNATVNDKATRNMCGALGAAMFFRAEHLHVRCAAHVLNIMVQHGLKVVSNSIKRVRDIVKTVTSTPSRMQIFNSIVERLGMKQKMGLVLDVQHRWNSTYDMLHEALEYRAALNRYADEQNQFAPTESEWANAEALHGFLQAFSEATKTFSADRHPTAHIFLKMVLAIRDVLLDETWNSDELLNELANAMYAKFEKYWAKPNIVLLIAAVLDPTQKLDYLRFYFYTIQEDIQQNIRLLCASMNRYYLEYEKIVRSLALPTFIQPEEQTATSEPTSSSSGGPLLGKKRVEVAFVEFTSQDTEVQTQLSDLDAYLKEPRVFAKPDEPYDVLAFWKRNADVYPVLSIMARDFLAIPVSTVSSESAFSAAGRILGKNRTSLSPETLEGLICAKDWLFGFSEEDEGQPMVGQRIFETEDEGDGLSSSVTFSY